MIITKPDGTVMELNSIDDVEMMVREAELQAAQLGKPEVITPETLEQVERRKTEFPDPNSLVVPGAEELTALDLFLGKKLFEFNGERLPRSLEARLQTMTTGGVGTGTELLDTAMLAQLWSDVHLATRVAPAFGPPIQMPTKTLDLPEELGDVTFYKPSGEGIAVTATDLATAKRAMTAYPLKAQVDVSDEEDQDAIIALLPMIRSSLVRNAGEVIDDVLINGDASTGTQNINQYNASGGTNIATDSKYLIGFDGLSHYCLNEVTGQTSDLGALADADYGTLIGLLGKYAANPDRLAWIMDPFAYAKALFLSEFRTMDKLGQFATVLTGQVGAVNSSPVPGLRPDGQGQRHGSGR